MVLIFGGSGFIGSNFIIYCLKTLNLNIINVDKQTYAGQAGNLDVFKASENYEFFKGDITNQTLVNELVQDIKPEAIVNFAAESHVDNSINNPSNFVQTNVIGVYNILEASRAFLSNSANDTKSTFRFMQISTDEVYGSLGPNEPAFIETNRFEPNSPYSASKAAGDHLTRAWNRTYGFPTLISNCSNNYGPYQHPEKFIPRVILNALRGDSLPIYGDGLHVRDWLHVEDHCKALYTILRHGRIGEVYNIGGCNEMQNIEVAKQICNILDKLRPKLNGTSYEGQIEFVADRPGHDRRYSMCCDKIFNELGWVPSKNFEDGLHETVEWYLNNENWMLKAESSKPI